MLIPDIKAVNALFRQLLPMLPFEPSLTDIIHQRLMGDLLLSIQDATYTKFTIKYQALQDAPYIFHYTQEATSNS